MKYLVLLLLVTVSFAQQKDARYQIVETKQSVFMIDSHTGKTWVYTAITDKEQKFIRYQWVPVKVDNNFIDTDNEKEYSPISSLSAVKPKK